MGHLKRSLVGALRISIINPNRVEPPIPLHSLLQLISRPSEKQNGALAGCVLASHFGLQLFIGLIVHWLRRCDDEEH